MILTQLHLLCRALICATLLPTTVLWADKTPPTMPGTAISDRTVEPLLKADRPWEDFCISYCQVIRMTNRWMMWYGSYDHRYQNDSDGFLCYAESGDGWRWTKPELGIFAYEGATKNNILLADGVHGACVFLDPEAPAGERFKLVFVKLVGNRWPVFGGSSPDGIHWTLGAKPLLDRNSDTQQTCYRDGDIYRLYPRLWTGPGDFVGHRAVGYSQAKQFGEFSDPVVMLQTDASDPPNLQFYNPAVAKLHPNVYVMFPSGFYTGEDVVRVHAALSSDGQNFQRVGRRPAMDLGTGFDSKGLYVGPGAVPADKPEQFWFYYLGVSHGHDEKEPAKLKSGGGIGSGGIGRFLVTLIPDGTSSNKAQPPVLPPGVQGLRNLEYIEGGHSRNRLDLYLPDKTDKPLPVIVYIHAGGWTAGDKAGCPLLSFVTNGYAVAAINYRFSQDAIFPAQIHDCKAAVRWLRANAESYHLDSDHFGVWGSSSGAQLAALLGTTAGIKEFEGQGGNREQSSRVQAVVEIAGPSDFLTAGAQTTRTKYLGGEALQNKAMAIKASPITYVSKDACPFVIIHGDKDERVPVSQSEVFATALKQAGVDTTLVIVKGAGHNGPGFRSLENMKQINEFFGKYLNQNKADQP